MLLWPSKEPQYLLKYLNIHIHVYSDESEHAMNARVVFFSDPHRHVLRSVKRHPMGYAKRKVSDQIAYPRSLIRVSLFASAICIAKRL